MTNIVDRLYEFCFGNAPSVGNALDICGEAAREIERLRLMVEDERTRAENFWRQLDLYMQAYSEGKTIEQVFDRERSKTEQQP